MRVLVALSIVLLWMGNDEGSSFAHPFDHVADQTHNTAFARAPLKIVTEGEEAWSAGVADDPDGLLLGNVKDVRLVFFGSPACAASTADRTAEVVGELKRTLNSELNDDEYTVSALGVSIESDVDKGYTFLSSFKVFDELITGNGWLNSGAVEYFWRQELTEPAVPQVLVLYREVQREGRFINVSEDSLLFKSLGIDELRRRLDSGQPFVGQ